MVKSVANQLHLSSRGSREALEFLASRDFPMVQGIRELRGVHVLTLDFQVAQEFLK